MYHVLLAIGMSEDGETCHHSFQDGGRGRGRDTSVPTDVGAFLEGGQLPPGRDTSVPTTVTIS